MQDIEYGAYVYVTAPNYSFREKHGTIGRFEKADEASSLIWVKFEKDQEIISVEPEFVSPVRKCADPASYKGEKVRINQPIISIDTNQVSYVIVYPDSLRGSATVEHHELSDWVEPEPTSDEVIADLTNQLYEVCTQYDIKAQRCDSLATGADKAMMIIGNRLIQEAEDRGWCDEFDRIIQEVNKELGDATGTSRFQLPVREVERTVRLMRRRVVTESIEVTVTVPANANEYEIAEIAEEDAAYCDWNEDDDEVDETWVDRIS